MSDLVLPCNLQDAGGEYTFLYFLVIVIICSFFLLNMVLAVISEAVEAFKEAEEEAALVNKGEEDAEKSWLKRARGNKDENLGEHPVEHAQHLHVAKAKKDKGCIMPLYRLVTTQAFENVIMAAIILNTMAMSLDSHPPQPVRDAFLEDISTVFSWVFIVEMLLKWFGLGFCAYIRSAANIFDMLLVMTSLAEILMPNSADGVGSLRVLRLFRAFRIFKLAKSWKSLRDLLTMVSKTIMESGNFLLLLVPSLLLCR
jgi:hypothetical protein